MMGLLNNDKKKLSVLIGEANPERKEEGQDQNPLVEKIFSSLSSGDKQGFHSAFKLLAKEVLYDMEMSEEESENESEGMSS